MTDCLQCVPGYSLVNGICIYISNCTKQQYDHYGECYDLPTGCLNFSTISNCTTCSYQYKLQNGVCVSNPLNCTNRTYYNESQYKCLPVSNLCGNFNSTDGNCTTCAKTTFALIKGKCVSNIGNCTSTQYILNGTCYEVTNFCVNFEKIGGSCINCGLGYALNQTTNVCYPINCSQRYFADNLGNCIKISDLCTDYKQIGGQCTGCIPGYVLVNNTCLQGLFHNPCSNDSILQADGTCVQSTVKCGPFQYIINNQCFNVSDSCGTWNSSNGRCLTCKDVSL
jgi:hypothetical protein